MEGPLCGVQENGRAVVTLVVTEGVAGVWCYHLNDEKQKARALCGAWTMPTSIKLECWGKTPPNYHIPESWCSKCAALRSSVEAR